MNLKGRDPNGRVEPGAPAQAILDELSAAFMELEHPRSGEKIVKTILRADDLYGAEHHPDLPDLLVEFRDDLGLIEACRSNRIGEIRMPIGKMLGDRTGDHNSHSRLWAMGPQFSAGANSGEACVLDIAPTVLSLLDVPLPDRLNGQTLAAH